MVIFAVQDRSGLLQQRSVCEEMREKGGHIYSESGKAKGGHNLKARTGDIPFFYLELMHRMARRMSLVEPAKWPRKPGIVWTKKACLFIFLIFTTLEGCQSADD